MLRILQQPIRVVLLIVSAGLIGGWIGPARAVDALPRGGPVHIEADRLAYDQDTDTYDAQGNVIITYAGGRLTARSVLLDHRSNTAQAEGDVRITSDRDVLEGDRITFNVADRTGVVYSGKMFVAQSHFYLRGKTIAKTGEATYRVEEAVATTCDGPNPDWRLTSREMNVTVDGYGTMKHGKFLVRNLPVLYVPYFIFPAKTTRQSGFLLPYLAQSDRHGLDIEIPFYWAISRELDATFYQRYMSKRGLKEGIEFRYLAGEHSAGVVYGDFLQDSKRVTETAGAISRDWQSDRSRWSFFLNHETTFKPGFYVRADIAKVSDPWYFKDFTDRNYYLDHGDSGGEDRFQKVSFSGDQSLRSLDSTVRVVKESARYNLTALARYTDDFTVPDNDVTPQRYPEVSLSRAHLPLWGAPVHYGLDAAYTYFYRGRGERGHLYDVAPAFSLPVKLGRFAVFTPQAGVRATLWDRDDQLRDARDQHGDRESIEAGFTLNTEFSRVFSLPGKSMERIRHAVKPEIAYVYAPSARQDDLPDYVVPWDARNLASYGLTQTLTARIRGKDGGVAYREILRFKVAQQFDLREARRDLASVADPGRRPFGELLLDLDLNPVSWADLVVRNRFDVHAGAWTQTNYDLNLRIGQGNSVTVGYRYTQNLVEEVNLNLQALLTKRIRLDYTLKKNRLDNLNVENIVQATYREQCWSFGLGYADTDKDRRFMLTFSLYGLGRIGNR